MNNDIRVSELMDKLRSDLEHWENKKQTAEATLAEATARVRELTQTVENLRKYVPNLAMTHSSVSSEVAISTGEFSGMSTREAIKIVLQRANGALSSADIARQLTTGGVKSESASFRSNVSATLSVMQSKYHEVQKTPSGWILSQPILINTEHTAEAAA